MTSLSFCALSVPLFFVCFSFQLLVCLSISSLYTSVCVCVSLTHVCRRCHVGMSARPFRCCASSSARPSFRLLSLARSRTLFCTVLPCLYMSSIFSFLGQLKLDFVRARGRKYGRVPFQYDTRTTYVATKTSRTAPKQTAQADTPRPRAAPKRSSSDTRHVLAQQLATLRKRAKREPSRGDVIMGHALLRQQDDELSNDGSDEQTTLDRSFHLIYIHKNSSSLLVFTTQGGGGVGAPSHDTP